MRKYIPIIILLVLSAFNVRMAEGLARKALVAPDCMINNLINVAKVASGRSYVPLKAKSLKKAEGKCPNILFASAEVKPVMEQHRIAEGVKVPIPDVYEYDLETEPGKTYLIK